MKNKFLFAMSAIMLTFLFVFLLSLALAANSIKIFSLGLPGVVENYIVALFSVACILKAVIEVHNS